MVAKLSSVRIITAASFDTSVPVMPIATPMSAFLSAGASFTPSPVMATMLRLPLERADQADLVLRRHAGHHADVVEFGDQLLVAHGGELGAGERLAGDAELVADRGGGHRVVAGDHAHLDAGAVALLDGRLRLGTGRIDDADHRQQREVVDVVEVRRGRVERGRDRSRGGRRPSPARPDAAMRSFSSSADDGARRRPGSWRRRASRTSPARSRSTSGAPLTKQRMTSRPWRSVIRWNVAMNL